MPNSEYWENPTSGSTFSDSFGAVGQRQAKSSLATLFPCLFPDLDLCCPWKDASNLSLSAWLRCLTCQYEWKCHSSYCDPLRFRQTLLGYFTLNVDRIIAIFPCFSQGHILISALVPESSYSVFGHTTGSQNHTAVQ